MKDYLDDAHGWYRDRYGSMRWQRNVAFGVAVVAMLCASAASIGLAALAPLKTVEPYLVRVHAETGTVSVMSALSATDEEWQRLTAEEALTQSFLVRYVIARETYSKVDLTRNYDSVRVTSAPETFRTYDEYWRDRKNGPFVRYGDDTVEADVKSVAFFNENTATVRFRTTWRQKISTVHADYVAVIRFNYSKTPLALGDRWKNPLGFVVTDYRVDQEQLEQRVTPTPPKQEKRDEPIDAVSADDAFGG